MPPAGNAFCPLEIRKNGEGRCPQARTLREARIGLRERQDAGIFDRGPGSAGESWLTKTESPF